LHGRRCTPDLKGFSPSLGLTEDFAQGMLSALYHE
jgi:hypothetical protein